MKERIVIIGFGWVGQANALALRLLGYPVAFYDPSPPPHKYPEYESTYAKLFALKKPLIWDGPNTYYIVCVGDRVSEDGVQDISLIEQALLSLKSAEGKVILRSTVLPESLQKLKFDFYMPEFLHEKKAVPECITPHYFVLGTTKKLPEPSFFKVLEARAYRVFRGTPEEASYIKYLSNVWNALRIAFTNEFGNAIRTPNTPDDIHMIERVTDFIFERKSYLRYGKSYGGHCLPKDSRAFARSHRDQGKNVALLDGMIESNNRQIEMEKQHPILPEWFSEWSPGVISGSVALRALFGALRRKLGR